MASIQGKNPSLVILTGAGISAESGIKTFRDHNGLWENHRVEDVASIDGYLKNPRLVQEFYNQRRAQLGESSVQPNAAHEALARLEQEWPGEFLLVTQNVDPLHERAGSRKLIHMHGELEKVRCDRTGQVFRRTDPVLPNTRCECCASESTLRPHIVWFGEVPFELERILSALQSCDIFAAIGTSGQVYPAAGFVRCVPDGARKVEINREASDVSDDFGERRIGLASQRVPEWVDELLA